MKKIIHKAENRGKADYGWLKTHYSFSFADWYDPNRMGFGALRVLNDDVVAPKSGFPMHSHRDFEIVTIVRKGAVTHEDSLGNKGVVSAGEVQAMSAGTGVTHSEINDEKEFLELFQIWIETDKKGMKPRYAQKKFTSKNSNGTWQTLISGDGREGSLLIYQDALISIADIEKGETVDYKVQYPGNGVYLFVIEGEVKALEEDVHARDALGVEGVKEFSIMAKQNSSILVIEVPIKI